MRRARVAVLSVLALVVAVVLAACNSTPATGSLKVTVSGLPSGATAAVTVTMGSFSQTVNATTTLSGLTPGTYTVAPQSVTLRRNVFDGTASKTTVKVAASATAGDSVSYSVQRGDLWVVDFGAGKVDMFSAGSLESSPSPSATISLAGGGDLAFDAAGNLWATNGGVVEFAAASLTSNPSPAATISFTSGSSYALAFDSSGNLWVTNYDGATSKVVEFSASTLTSSPSPAATITTGLDDPSGLAFDTSGNLWVTNRQSNTVVEYTASTLTSSPSPAAAISAGLSNPEHLAFDAAGNLWVGNQTTGAVEFAAASLTSSPSPMATVATGVSDNAGVAFDVTGSLWVTHQVTTVAVEEFAAADIAGTGSLTPTAKATIGAFNNAQQSAFDPPPYNLPLSH